MVMKEKLKIISLIFIGGILCIALILSTAYSAAIKYKINMIQKENNMIIGEIENLTVKINNGKNIQLIEKRAELELGMIYPMPDQFVYVSRNPEKLHDFALVLKERAYN